jgi:hypothetical protein
MNQTRGDQAVMNGDGKPEPAKKAIFLVQRINSKGKGQSDVRER